MVGRGMREGKHLEIMEDWCWGWSSNALATWCKEMTHWERLWCWERLKAGGEGNERGWDGWMASRNWWTWVWAISRSWWWTGKPGVLQSMGLQRVVHDWVTELNWTAQKSSDKVWQKLAKVEMLKVHRCWHDQEVFGRSNSCVGCVRLWLCRVHSPQ